MSHRLLFVCTANICRSPMAEGLAISIGNQYGRTIEARSRSVRSFKGAPAATNAIKVMKELGIDISSHRSSRIKEQDLHWADYVLVMAPKHAMVLREKFPQQEHKILQLATFGGHLEIEDPVGKWKFTFRRIRRTITTCLERFVSQLPSNKG